MFERIRLFNWISGYQLVRKDKLAKEIENISGKLGNITALIEANGNPMIVNSTMDDALEGLNRIQKILGLSNKKAKAK